MAWAKVQCGPYFLPPEATLESWKEYHLGPEEGFMNSFREWHVLCSALEIYSA